MNKTKMAIGTVALLALLSVGAVTAHGWNQADEHCTDDQTVADCRDTIQAARSAEQEERLAEKYDEQFAADLIGLQEEHRAESEALLADHGIEGKPDIQPERPTERPQPDDDRTVEEWRAQQDAAREQAFYDACVDAYGSEFCDAFIALKAEHKAEVQQLFDDADYELPEGKGPGGAQGGPGSPRGPAGHGKAPGPRRG